VPRCALDARDGQVERSLERRVVVGGRLEPELSNIEGLGPYVFDTDTVHIGDREGDPGELAAVAKTSITVRRLHELRTSGPIVPAVPYWVHVDADVIDSALLPAVDSPAPDGLTFDELATLLRLTERYCVVLQTLASAPDLSVALDRRQASL